MNPILPRDLSNPTGTGRLIKKADGQISRRRDAIYRRVKALLDSLSFTKLDAYGNVINNALPPDHWLYANAEITYQYELSASILDQISAEIERILNEEWMQSPTTRPPENWWLYASVDGAYEQGTALAVANLSAIAPTQYTRDLAQVVSSPEYRSRVAYLRARNFELMRGVVEETRAQLSDALSRGMENGDNPLEIARALKKRTGVSAFRARRIARTEINMAHRRARWDENDDAEKRLGIITRELWLSALSPTTRRTHAARHGKVYTRAEVKDFYSRDANGINCRCGQTSVVVDEDGKPIDGGKTEARLQKRSEKFLKTLDDK